MERCDRPIILILTHLIILSLLSFAIASYSLIYIYLRSLLFCIMKSPSDAFWKRIVLYLSISSVHSCLFYIARDWFRVISDRVFEAVLFLNIALFIAVHSKQHPFEVTVCYRLSKLSAGPGASKLKCLNKQVESLTFTKVKCRSFRCLGGNIELYMRRLLIKLFTSTTISYYQLRRSIQYTCTGQIGTMASSSPPTKKQKRSGRGARAQYRNDNERKEEAKLPQKRFFRQRAHANPFSDHHLI